VNLVRAANGTVVPVLEVRSLILPATSSSQLVDSGFAQAELPRLRLLETGHLVHGQLGTCRFVIGPVNHGNMWQH
jgi:hypothetical protein